jgi:hypothetical protein
MASETITVLNMRLAFALALLLATLVTPVWSAEGPRELNWDDLAPKAPGEELFAKLTRDQLADLGQIAWVRDRKARGQKVTPGDAADERTLSQKLKQAGIDVDDLLGRRKAILEQHERTSAQVNASLNGKVVRIPGFVLPLEYSGRLVSEFLLVPWVGACIHTPPPPPNQIVHVKPDRPFQMQGIFAPVWVSGTLSTASSKRSLFMVDGSSNIDVGYSLKASLVEPYKE